MQTGFWRKCRVCVRWLRWTALVAVVALIGALVWFNRVGLPDFLKQRLVEKLREQGIELNFVRLRLSPVRGLIAQNVSIGKAATPGGPEFSAQEVGLEINYAAVLRRQFQLDGLVITRGKVVVPVSPTNDIVLNNIRTDLRFGANETWSLDKFQADLDGARLALSGDIVHAPEIRNWEIFYWKTNAPSGQAMPLRDFFDALRQIHFSGQPQLNLNVSGDARDIHTFDARLIVKAPAVRTSWGHADGIQLTAKLTSPADAPTNANPALAWWSELQPYRISWSLRLAQLTSPQLNASALVCDGIWRAPELVLTNLSADLGGGTFEARAGLNVFTREMTFTNFSRFDLHAIAALLTEKTRERLAGFSWPEPPSLHVDGSLILPAWTNREPDWRDRVQPTIRLRGELAFTNGAVSGLVLDSAAGRFAYSNLIWRVPALALAQSQTRLEISGDENDATKNYNWRLRGTFDPDVLRPFLTESNAEKVFRCFTITEPVHLNADLRGRLYDYDSIGASGHLALTNFTVRGEAVDNVAGDFSYTNRVLSFSHPRLWRGGQTLTADGIALDFNARSIRFTNGYSTADPQAVARAIGRKAGEIMEPYHFLRPPTVRVEGRAPLHDVNAVEDMDDADLRFDVVGGAPFECLNFHSRDVTGTVHWKARTVILTNIAAEVYGGGGNGWAFFDFSVPHEGADYQFAADVTNVDLQALALDLSSPTNHLEGRLTGNIFVMRGDTRDWRSVDGFGQVSLRDGLLWDIPVIGIISPILNSISPGLGNSRATDAAGRFVITNGVIYSDSLEIHSTMMRLAYSGTVDLKQNVNATVTAELLRDTPYVGQVVSALFSPLTKLFEYKITGTLDEPKKTTVYLPNFILMPLHPIRSLGQLFLGGTLFTNPPPDK